VKEHRWIYQPMIPVKAQKNEDNHIFLKLAEDDVLRYPGAVWCYDCEQQLSEAFGQECEGFLGIPNNKDLTMSDESWEKI